MGQVYPVSQPTNGRLDSWKEIAAFFDRDERTVRRWEKERSLPVYRTPGKARGSVYAFTSELSQWLKSPAFRAGESAESPAFESPASESLAPVSASQSDVELNLDAPAAELLVAPDSVIAPKNHWKPLAVTFALCILVVTAALLIHLHSSSTASARSIPVAHTVSPEVRDLYLKGRFEWSKRTPAGLTSSVDYFTQAIVRDPQYAQAYAGLADSYNLLREYAGMPEREAYPRAIQAARKAVELDDSLSEAHRSLAFASFYWTWDFPFAEREFKRAIALNPRDAEAHHWYATSLLPLGRFPEAVSEMDIARQLDPSSASIAADRAIVLFDAGQSQESVSLLKRMAAVDPSFRSPHRYLADIAFQTHDYPTYLSESRKVAQMIHDQPSLDMLRTSENAFARGSEKALLENIRTSQMREYAQGAPLDFELAETCAWLGKNEESLHYLQSDLDKHDPQIVNIMFSQALRPLHSDPRFQSIVSRIHLHYAAPATPAASAPTQK